MIRAPAWQRGRFEKRSSRRSGEGRTRLRAVRNEVADDFTVGGPQQGGCAMLRKYSLTLMLVLVVVVPLLLFGAGSSRADDGDHQRNGGPVKFLKGIPVPGTTFNTTSPGKMNVYDISWVDQATQRYYLADRSNVVIDVVDAKTDTFLRQISGGFKGFTGNNDTSGPNGVLVIGRPGNQFLIVTDAPSRVVSINLQTDKIVNAVSTGGADAFRADELAFDPVDNLLLPVNNADPTPFATLVKVDPNTGVLTQPKNVEGVDRISFPDATNGAEQPVWDPNTRRFYISIPEVNGQKRNGAVKRINPQTAKVENTFPVQDCQPAGLTLGPHGDLLLGCSVIFNTGDATHPPAVWTGLTDPFTAAPTQIIMDARTGEIDRVVAGVGGSDEVWFNPGDRRYYTASRANPGAVPNGTNPPTDPVLGVIDAESQTLVQIVPTFNTPNPTLPAPRGTAHSVAVNSHNNHVFVPLPANNVFPGCLTGCIAACGTPQECGEDRD